MPFQLGLPTVGGMDATGTEARTNRWDCVVVGGSVAGLSAALMLGRARRSTLVVDAGEPVNRTVDHAHGYLTRDGEAPAEILRLGRAEVARYGVEVRPGRVSAIRRIDPDGDAGFVVEVDAHDGPATLAARRVVLATGAAIDLPDIPGVAETWGRGTANCPYCHGWEVRDRALGVLAVDVVRGEHLATLLRQWSDDVTLYLHGAEPPAPADTLAAAGITIESRVITRVQHDGGEVTGLTLADGSRHACGGLFLAVAPRPRADLAASLGAELDDNGGPVVDATGLTSVPGLWVVGNAANPMLNLIGSAAAGNMAGAMVNADLTFAWARAQAAA
jgi:thioredoxin reductase